MRPIDERRERLSSIICCIGKRKNTLDVKYKKVLLSCMNTGIYGEENYCNYDIVHSRSAS